jgi:hypothetical protein
MEISTERVEQGCSTSEEWCSVNLPENFDNKGSAHDCVTALFTVWAESSPSPLSFSLSHFSPSDLGTHTHTHTHTLLFQIHIGAFINHSVLLQTRPARRIRVRASMSAIRQSSPRPLSTRRKSVLIQRQRFLSSPLTRL